MGDQFLRQRYTGVRGKSGDTWSVVLIRGNQWTPWRWLESFGDRLAGADSGPFPLGFVIGLLVAFATVFPRVWRWLSYRRERRTDWRVQLQRGAASGATPVRNPALDVGCATRAEAAETAQAIVDELKAGWEPPREDSA